MVPRDHGEDHRQASWLELLFDLSFVVAVAQAGIELEHALAAGHAGAGLIGYCLVFAAIWWAWMGFTWFANAFDTDDVPFRVLTMIMIAGSLGLAAGVPRIAELDFRIAVISYVVIRLAYIGQWARVLGAADSRWRRIAWLMIVLTTGVQLGWVAFLWIPAAWKLPGFALLFAADIAIPYLAGWDARMAGHAHHIVERYGLFTIIVLGESIAAATAATSEALGADATALPLLSLALGGLIIVGAIWWIYFDFSTGRAPTRDRRSQYLWGYLHYFVFAAVAAIGVGLALAADSLAEPDGAAPAALGALTVGGAIAVFLVTIAFIEGLAEGEGWRSGVLVKLLLALGVVTAAFAAERLTPSVSILVCGILLAAVVAYGVVLQHRLHAGVA